MLQREITEGAREKWRSGKGKTTLITGTIKRKKNQGSKGNLGVGRESRKG